MADDNDPSVSVVVRSFNEANKLVWLIEDIHNQLFSGEVELVVVDDGSSDRTPRVANILVPKWYHFRKVTLITLNR